MGLVNHPAAPAGRTWVGGEQQLLPAEREDRHLSGGDPQLHSAAGADLRPGHPVVAGFEGDQRILANPAGVPLPDYVGMLGQRAKGGPVALGADRDDLAVGAVHLGPASGQPGGEGGVHLVQPGEPPAAEHMGAYDLDLPLDPSLGLRSARAASQIANP
jgi:hypothetical protein